MNLVDFKKELKLDLSDLALKSFDSKKEQEKKVDLLIARLSSLQPELLYSIETGSASYVSNCLRMYYIVMLNIADSLNLSDTFLVKLNDQRGHSFPDGQSYQYMNVTRVIGTMSLVSIDPGVGEKTLTDLVEDLDVELKTIMMLFSLKLENVLQPRG